MSRLVLIAGLFGAAGVGLSALAAHAGGADLNPASLMLLIHAPALLAIGLAAVPPLTRYGGWMLAGGALLFACDIVVRHFLGHRLFPMAAPTGGVAMIAGWLVVSASALLRR